MIYKDSENHIYIGGNTMTKILENGSLFSGIPTTEQLSEWGYVLQSEPEPYTPTAEELVRQRMQEILDELRNTDYLALKAFEGEDMSDHIGWKEQRAALREEYRRLEEQLNNLQL